MNKAVLRDQGHVRPVVLNVYSLTGANSIFGALGVGAYHSGVVVDGKEWAFSDQGYTYTEPGLVAEELAFKERVEIGEHFGTLQNLEAAIASLRGEFAKGAYHLVKKNCNHFANALCRKLCEGAGIPSWVNRAASFGGTFLPSSSALKTSKGKPKGKATGGGGGGAGAAGSLKRPELTEKQKALLDKMKGPKA
jgi:hypothetical protein